MIGEWTLDDGDARSFLRASRTVKTEGGDLVIQSGGHQYGNGTICSHLSINGDIYLSASETRDLITQLNHLADDLDRLTATTG
ncbi:Uncharacterised protein [Mycolicibacterium fortuitum]|uniref:Uncharacterized protein n=1 Tax=Mycolicibacterium fortuitum TaxID=1766 RepID=A0A378U9E7_MYCFO|nr:Uncharacterised protein [Mycolicibacterium fortuitum]